MKISGGSSCSQSGEPESYPNHCTDHKRISRIRTLFELVAVFTLSACTTNLNFQKTFSVPGGLLPPASETSSDTSGAFTLGHVLKNSTNPTGVLDVIGDGSGTLGNFCGSSSGGSDGSSTSTFCTCTFAYSTSSLPNQKIEVPITYAEPNLVRCPYNSLPTEVSSVTLSIHLVAGDLSSSKVKVNLNQSSSTLNLTNPLSFVQATRYQCRQLVTISNLFNSSVYDPFQSEDFDPGAYSTSGGLPIMITSVSGLNIQFTSLLTTPKAGDTISDGSATPAISSLTSNGNNLWSATMASGTWAKGTTTLFPASETFSRPRINLTYPLNFYATNLALALTAFSQSATGNSVLPYWSCPSILNPSAFMSATDVVKYETDQRLNSTIYSRVALTGMSAPESKLIYPAPSPTPVVSPTPSPRPSGSDRSTFYLAKSASGLFSVPVDAYLAPGIVTSQTSTTAPSLGYGARPISTHNGETCPGSDLQKIPTGFHWVKVWLFRASLPPRTYYNQGNTAPQITGVGAVACNPGNWPSSGNGPSPIFVGCPVSGSAKGSFFSTGAEVNPLSIALEDVVDTNTGRFLSDRVLASGQCVRLDSQTYATPKKGPLECQTDLTQAGPSCGPNHLDQWLTWYLRDPSSTVDPNPTPSPSPSSVPPIHEQYPDFRNDGCGLSNFLSKDHLALCTNGEPVTGSSPTPVKTGGLSVVKVDNNENKITNGTTPVVPKVTQYGTAELDSGSARYDYLFVVTPKTVTVQNMQNASSSNDPTNPALQYWPYRFRTREDCTSADPDSPAPNDCLTSNKITYFLKLHAVNTPDDPPGSSTVRAGDFPICAIQPDP